MKSLIVLLFIYINGTVGYSNTLKDYKFCDKYIFHNGIADGWYAATVKYSNYNTGTYSTYSLNVKVEYGNVTTIDFGNGGSVHTGYNNEGYIYSGGYLSSETDFNGNIIAVTTTVTISNSDGIKYFKIRIE